MPEVTKYPAGTPSWVDLASPDVDRSLDFYGQLLGWTFDEGSPETGGYRMARKGGKSVAGVAPLMEGQPPAWTTYISVDDADKTAAAVGEAGGQVLMEPMDVMNFGRMAIFMDPTGAAIAVWQPRDHIGSELVNEPGAVVWNELATRDADAAKEFYSAVFGWNWTLMSPDGDAYWLFLVGERTTGGLMPMVGDMWPPEIPSHWMVYFDVDDADAAAAKVTELGGSVTVPPTDIPPGRFAVVNDPSGAVFSIIAVTQPDPAP